MRRWLAFFLALQTNVRVKAGNLDVLPQPVGGTVAQCSNLTLVWDQPPPIHLHVQPDRSITITNLRDLGIQNETFMIWTVDLPVNVQQFTFAYNTLAIPTIVYQSVELLHVGPGTTKCLSRTVNPVSSVQSSSTSSTPSTPNTASTSGTSSTASASGISTITNTPRPTPVSGIVGGLLLGVCLATALVYTLFRLRRRRLCRKYLKKRPTVPSVLRHSPSEPEDLPSMPRARSLRPVTPVNGLPRMASSHPQIPPFDSTNSNQPAHRPESTRPRTQQLSPASGHGDSFSPVSPPPMVHIDGGFRIQEELPPVYQNYR